MTTLTSRLVVSLIDQVSGPARKAGAAIQGLVRQASTAARAQTQVVAGIQRQMMVATTQARSAMASMRGNAMHATAAFAAPLALAGRFGFQAAYEFQKVGNNVQAVTQMTDEQRKSLEGYAQSLNNLFPFTNAEIMKAAFELGRAGLSFEQIMGALRGTLNLGLAGDIELQQASDIATNVMTAMGLPMKTAEEASKSLTRVNDALAYSASRSNTDVRLMGETFKYVAPIARVVGMNIEQVAAAAMVMANNGIKGSEAGVALRSMLIRMVKPTGPALKALDRLKISLSDFVTHKRKIAGSDLASSLQLDGITMPKGAVQQMDRALNDPRLKKSVGAMTAALTKIVTNALGSGSIVDKEKVAESVSTALTSAGSEVDLFGFIRALKDKGAVAGDIANIIDARQAARLLALFGANLDDVVRDVLEKSVGAADKMAKTRMQGIVGEVARFKAGWENLWVTIGNSGVLSDIGAGLTKIAEGMERLAKSNPALLKFGTYAAGALAVLGPIGLLAGGVAASVGMLAGGFKLLAAGATLAAGGALLAILRPLRALRFALFAGGPIGAALAAIAAAGTLIYNNWNGLGTFFQKFGEAFSKAIGPAPEWITPLTTALQNAWDMFTQFFGEIDASGEKWAAWGTAAGEAIGNVVSAIMKIPNAVGSLPGKLQSLLGFGTDNAAHPNSGRGDFTLGSYGTFQKGAATEIGTGSFGPMSARTQRRAGSSPLGQMRFEIEDVGRKADEARGKLDGLTSPVKPNIDASDLVNLLRLITQADAGLSRLGERASAIKREVAGALQAGGQVRQAFRGVHADTTG
ncbi:MAG: phage tail tape measure protein [Beijerinckiaceae bacterium]|nr:phage tail tape measure protein [Beijerinckiaceae bacterium]